jgi:hypothetical protein
MLPKALSVTTFVPATPKLYKPPPVPDPVPAKKLVKPDEYQFSIVELFVHVGVPELGNELKS